MMGVQRKGTLIVSKSEPLYGAVDRAAVLAAQGVQIKHIAVPAAFAAPFAAVPGIPDAVQGASPHFWPVRP